MEERSGFAESSFLSSEGFAPVKSNDALGHTGLALYKLARSLEVLEECSSLGINAREGVRVSVEASGTPEGSRT